MGKTTRHQQLKGYWVSESCGHIDPMLVNDNDKKIMLFPDNCDSCRGGHPILYSGEKKRLQWAKELA